MYIDSLTVPYMNILLVKQTKRRFDHFLCRILTRKLATHYFIPIALNWRFKCTTIAHITHFYNSVGCILYMLFTFVDAIGSYYLYAGKYSNIDVSPTSYIPSTQQYLS